MDLKAALQKIIKGDVYDDEQTLTTFSKDASIFEIRPQLVVTPKDAADIKALIKFVNSHPDLHLSLTPRSAGTCMSGGSLTDSIVLDMTKYFNKILKVGENYAFTEPGVYYRDFEKETLKKDLLLPCFTASREINTVGGMVGNNSAGEKTLTFGQTEKYVKSLKMILADGNEYTFGPLDKTELQSKIKQKDFEGEVYKEIFGLLQENIQLIQNAKPATSKNSTGYYLWNVYDGKIFNMAKLIVGSQGTLGIVTEIEFELIKPKKSSTTLIITLKTLKDLDKIINEVLKFHPEGFECFDNQTLHFATKFLPEIIKDIKGKHDLKMYFQFLPEFIMKLTGSFPPLILLAEFTGDSEEQTLDLAQKAAIDIQQFDIKTQIMPTQKAEKEWIIRRQSFSLLRHYSTKMKTSPFVDDIIVKPEYLPEFLPKLNALFAPYKKKMIYTVAGHIGDGNFHIIPLMDFKDEETRAIIPELSQKVFDLVFAYKGSMAAEHNDGLIRSPYLPKMYGENVFQLFKQVKEIFDFNNIFNPHKKTDATFKYSLEHIVKS